MGGETTMQYANLGRSGLKVSKVIFGAMSLGSSDWQDWVQVIPIGFPLYQRLKWVLGFERRGCASIARACLQSGP